MIFIFPKRKWPPELRAGCDGIWDVTDTWHMAKMKTPSPLHRKLNTQYTKIDAPFLSASLSGLIRSRARADSSHSAR